MQVAKKNKLFLHPALPSTLAPGTVGMSLLACVLLLAAPYAAQAFYLPGIAPTDYKAGSPMNVKVGATRLPRPARLKAGLVTPPPLHLPLVRQVQRQVQERRRHASSCP